ncbi:hypothetical protein TWF718_008575 [Orbilia javanica]|uniref:Uncharacterized protein n=1 Tax=Orbilia javanica TaxID=47235 RepID=A0AAN8NRH9_9PEZI
MPRRRRASTCSSGQTSNSSHSTNLSATATEHITISCTALKENGSNCPLVRTDQKYCVDHRKEYQGLYETYKIRHKEYGEISLETQPPGVPDSAESRTWKTKILAKIATGKETARLRSQVNRRFFSQTPQNQSDRNHIREILKLEFEVRTWKQYLETWNQEEKVFQDKKRVQELIEAERARAAQARIDKQPAMFSQRSRDIQIAEGTKQRIIISLQQIPHPPIIEVLYTLAVVLAIPAIYDTISIICSFFYNEASGPDQAPTPGAAQEPETSQQDYPFGLLVTTTIGDYTTKIIWWWKFLFVVAWFLLHLAIYLVTMAVDQVNAMVENAVDRA